MWRRVFETSHNVMWRRVLVSSNPFYPAGTRANSGRPGLLALFMPKATRVPVNIVQNLMPGIA